MSLYVGLDLGGTNLKYALGDETGNLLVDKFRPSHADVSRESVFDTMAAAVEEMIVAAEKIGEKISGIGVGSPGSIDFEEGRLIGGTPNIVNWADAPIKATLEKRFSLPVVADNDANIMALAEARLGAAKGFQNILCLTLGTGIGGGILFGGKMWRGSHFSGAEVGHFIINYGGRLCNCGNHGCFEQYASATGLVKNFKKVLEMHREEQNFPEINPRMIFKLGLENHPLALEAIYQTIDYLAAGIASIANVIDPEIVVIGGGISETEFDLIGLTQKKIKEFSVKAITAKLIIKRAEMGNKAGTVGAILLAAENC
ncbi:MAG: ROK family protein [Calditrichaeota bacterium]|nr:ROK family protein [Calditrichota bacterium]